MALSATKLFLASAIGSGVLTAGAASFATTAYTRHSALECHLVSGQGVAFGNGWYSTTSTATIDCPVSDSNAIVDPASATPTLDKTDVTTLNAFFNHPISTAHNASASACASSSSSGQILCGAPKSLNNTLGVQTLTPDTSAWQGFPGGWAYIEVVLPFESSGGSPVYLGAKTLAQ